MSMQRKVPRAETADKLNDARPVTRPADEVAYWPRSDGEHLMVRMMRDAFAAERAAMTADRDAGLAPFNLGAASALWRLLGEEAGRRATKSAAALLVASNPSSARRRGPRHGGGS